MDDPQDATDGQLLRSADPSGFGLVYERHVRAVLGFLYRRTASAELAADLAAETFAQALISRKRFRDRGVPARAWLLGIARKKLAQTLRTEKVAARALARLGVEPPGLDQESYRRIEELADLGPLRASLREAMASLPEGVARAVSLRIAHDLPYEEVARELGCSVGAARVRVARGLSRLTREMEGADG